MTPALLAFSGFTGATGFGLEVVDAEDSTIVEEFAAARRPLVILAGRNEQARAEDVAEFARSLGSGVGICDLSPLTSDHTLDELYASVKTAGARNVENIAALVRDAIDTTPTTAVHTTAPTPNEATAAEASEFVAEEWATASCSDRELRELVVTAGGDPHTCPACNKRGALRYLSNDGDDLARFRCALGCEPSEVLRLLEIATRGHDDPPSKTAKESHQAAEPVTPPSDEPVGWPVPAPLTQEPLPAFPVHVFPQPVGEFVQAVAMATQSPTDAAAAMVLASAATAAAGAVRVEAKPGWLEEVMLFVAVVMASGERKSAVLDHVGKPLRDIERERQEKAQPVVREAKAKIDVLESKRAAMVRKEPDYLAIAEIDAELEALAKVRRPRLLTDDVTPEGVAGLLDGHGSIGVLSAEGAFLANALGRYSDGNARVEIYNKAYSAERHPVDRRGSDPLILDEPRLTLGILAQPVVLEQLAGNAFARGTGLVARFAMLVPHTLVGRRATNPPPVPSDVSEEWSMTIRRLADLPRGEGLCRFCRLSPGARSVFDEWHAQHEPRLQPGVGDLAGVGDWAARHPGRVIRIAALLHLLAGEEPSTPISPEVMEGAQAIGEHLALHALRALGADPTGELLRVVRWVLEKHERPTLTVRDVHRGCFGAKGPSDPARRAVDLLKDLGWLRQLAQQTSAQGGRPLVEYAIHPELREAIR